MIISVMNQSRGLVTDEELHHVVRAINRQIRDDFEPYWSLGATLRVEGRAGGTPKKQTLADMRGDAVLYVRDKADVQKALGYHDANNRGIPFGFVFLDLVAKYDEAWSATLSHEALETILDPEVNLLVQGPHPTEPDRDVFHWYEAGDAVQAETYVIDGVEVSNFVLPLYFTSGDETGGRNDFLGRTHGKKLLTSFGVHPGGYIGFFDPKLDDHDTHAIPGDDVAAQRMKVRGLAKAARRASRHQTTRVVRKRRAR